MQTDAMSAPPPCMRRIHSASRANRPCGAVMIGVYRSHTMTTSNGSPSTIDSCGSTRMPPKQRNGSGSAATIRTSRSASPGSPMVMSGKTAPTDPRTSNRPNRIAGDVSGAANNATRGLPAPRPDAGSPVASVIFAPIRCNPSLAPSYDVQRDSRSTVVAQQSPGGS